MITQKTVLVSFVGANDKGDIPDHGEGAIITTFKERKFEETHLLWCRSQNKKIDFQIIAEGLKNKLESKGLCKEVFIHYFPCKNVTDHNEIYPKLLKMCQKQFDKRVNVTITAAIASGTPAMQACWILLAESGDYKLELIRTDEPKFGKPYVKPVKLNTTLPKVMSLKQENLKIKKENLSLLPILEIKRKDGKIRIGTVTIKLSPMEFSFYRFFAEREEPLKLSYINLNIKIAEKIYAYHKEAYPYSDRLRQQGEQYSKSPSISLQNTRANISRINKKINGSQIDPILKSYYSINIGGNRHCTEYYLNVPKEKILLID